MADKQEPATNVEVEVGDLTMDARDMERLDVETLLKENMKLKEENMRLRKKLENQCHAH